LIGKEIREKKLEFLKFWHLGMGMYDGSVYGGSKV
jgi:hypothetical protein